MVLTNKQTKQKTNQFALGPALTPTALLTRLQLNKYSMGLRTKVTVVHLYSSWYTFSVSKHKYRLGEVRKKIE